MTSVSSIGMLGAGTGSNSGQGLASSTGNYAWSTNAINPQHDETITHTFTADNTCDPTYALSVRIAFWDP